VLYKNKQEISTPAVLVKTVELHITNIRTVHKKKRERVLCDPENFVQSQINENNKEDNNNRNLPAALAKMS